MPVSEFRAKLFKEATGLRVSKFTIDWLGAKRENAEGRYRCNNLLFPNIDIFEMVRWKVCKVLGKIWVLVPGTNQEGTTNRRLLDLGEASGRDLV